MPGPRRDREVFERLGSMARSGFPRDLSGRVAGTPVLSTRSEARQSGSAAPSAASGGGRRHYAEVLKPSGAAPASTYALTYQPVDQPHWPHLAVNGLIVPAGSWSISGQTVTVSGLGLASGDELWVGYDYLSGVRPVDEVGFTDVTDAAFVDALHLERYESTRAALINGAAPDISSWTIDSANFTNTFPTSVTNGYPMRYLATPGGSTVYTLSMATWRIDAATLTYPPGRHLYAQVACSPRFTANFSGSFRYYVSAMQASEWTFVNYGGGTSGAVPIEGMQGPTGLSKVAPRGGFREFATGSGDPDEGVIVHAGTPTSHFAVACLIGWHADGGGFPDTTGGLTTELRFEPRLTLLWGPPA